MPDIDLYQYLLGLSEPWQVDRVELNHQERRVDIWAGHAAGITWSCPECGLASPTRDHAAERVWRHLDSCQFETYLHARIPRVACAQHGVRQVIVPWAEPDSRFTKQFERLAVGILAECRVSGTAAVLGLSWDEAQGMRERAARRREARRNARLHNGKEEDAVPGSISNTGHPVAASDEEPRASTTNGRAASNRQVNHVTRSVSEGSKKREPAHNTCEPRLRSRGKLQRRAS